MMQKKLFIPAVLCVLLLGACGKQTPSNISELKDPTPADSMMYYLGEMVAAAYWQDAETDTLLRTEKARKEFLEGVKAVLDLKEHERPFYRGLDYGVELAKNIRKYHKRYDTDFSGDIAYAALCNGLKVDHRDSVFASQKGFYKIKDLMELKSARRELEVSKELLAEEAAKEGFEIVSDTLFAKDVTPAGKGRKFRDGDRVAVEVTAYTLDGKEIVARQFPDSITLGAGNVPRIVALGIHTMTDGQTRTFMTTPRTLFGKRYRIYHLPYDQPVIFTVKVTG